MRITITTANITGNPMRARVFVRRRMRRALKQSGVVFGQEGARSNRWGLRRLLRRAADYSEMWRRVAAHHGKATYGGPHEVPISVPESWTVLAHRVVKVHAGLRRVSPARFINVVRAEVGGYRVAFVNIHAVSKPRPGYFASRWRMRMWDLYIQRLGEIVAELVDEGFTVTYGGDPNKRDLPQIHPRELVLIHSGLDHLRVVPAEGVEATVVSRSKVGRTALMDHPILTATFELESAA